MPLIQRDIEAMPILYEVRTHRPSRTEKINAWCSRKFRALKRSFTTKIIIAILLFGIFAAMLFYIAILLRIPNIPHSESQIPNVKGSPALSGVLQNLKQNLEPGWAALKVNSERENRKRRAVREVDYSWPIVVTVFLLCVTILLAVVVALAIFWLVKELRSRTCIRSVRNDDLGGYQRINQDLEDQFDGPADAWSTVIVDWREDIYTPASDAEFSVLGYDQFQPEQEATPSTGYSATPFDVQQFPSNLGSQNHPAPVNYFGPQGYCANTKDSVACSACPQISSSYLGHGEQLTSKAAAPIEPLPNVRREQSQSTESSNSGITDPAQQLLDDARILRHTIDGVPDRTCLTVPLNGKSINRAAPGVVVFKNLSGDDFTEDRVLEMEEGRIFWHC